MSVSWSESVPLERRDAVTQAQFAALTGLSRDTVRAMMAEPGFPTYLPPGGVRRVILRAAALRWMEHTGLEVAS